MKKSIIFTMLLLVLIPLVSAQQFMDLVGTYETYWQWFDLAIWVILFTSLAEFVFVQKMNMHRGIAVGLGLALGLSMLMLEVAGGFRIAYFGPYVVLIIALLLWVLLWMFLNTVVSTIMGGSGHQLWTGIVSFLFAMIMLTTMLKAAGTVGAGLGFLESFLDFLVMIQGFMMLLFVTMLFAGLIALVLRVLPGVNIGGGMGGGGGIPTPEVSKRDLQTMKEDVKKMGDQLKRDMEIKLGEIGTRLSQLSDDVKRLSDRVNALENMLKTVQEDLNEVKDNCNQIAVDVEQHGELLDKHKKWIYNLITYVRKLRSSLKSSIDGLKTEIAEGKKNIEELRNRVNGIETTTKANKDLVDKISGDIAKIERDFADNKTEVLGLKTEQEQIKAKITDIDVLRRNVGTLILKAEDAQAQLIKQQEQLNINAESFTKRLDELEDKAANKVLVERELQHILAALRDTSSAAQKARDEAAAAQSNLKAHEIHIVRLEEASNAINVYMEQAEKDLADTQMRLQHLTEELVKFDVLGEELGEKLGVREGEMLSKKSKAIVDESIKSLNLLAKELNSVKVSTERIVNSRVGKMKDAKDASKCLNEFNVLLRAAQKGISNSRKNFEVSLEKNKKVQFSSVKAKQEYIQLISKESGILELEKDIEGSIEEYVAELKRRLPEIELKPKPIETMQEQFRKLMMDIHEVVDKAIATAKAKREDMESKLAEGTYP